MSHTYIKAITNKPVGVHLNIRPWWSGKRHTQHIMPMQIMSSFKQDGIRLLLSGDYVADTELAKTMLNGCITVRHACCCYLSMQIET